MVRSAADMILGYLKDDQLRDLDRKREIEALLSAPVANDAFNQLVTLGKKITDYGDDDEGKPKPGDDDDGALDASKIDDDVGVAVVFEEEEDDDDDQDGEGFEVRDDDDSDSDEDERIEGPTGTGAGDDALDTAGLEGDETVLVGSGSGSRSAPSSSKKRADGVVPAREIDGFWLQRLFASHYADPVAAAQKTETAMDLLSSEGSARDVENALMDLTEYDKFELVSALVTNRDRVVWCTKLARSNDDERMDVEVAMREKGVGWILKELRGDAAAAASASSSKRAADGDAMDVDTKVAVSGPSKGTLKPGEAAPPPRKTVDLESMAFAQGGRLMSNKKCKLPEGSFKRSKKGYEEVHVPAPKPAPLKDGELVPVSSLPEWAQAAFKGNPNLNRVQSRLYPVAFGTDEPILLCAPTGAGKVRPSSLPLGPPHAQRGLVLTLPSPSLSSRRPTSPCSRSSTSSPSTATSARASSTSRRSRSSTSRR